MEEAAIKPPPTLKSTNLPHYFVKVKCSTIKLQDHISDTSFVALLMPFNFMKTNDWHSFEQCTTETHPLTSGMHNSKHVLLPKADILNTCGKLI